MNRSNALRQGLPVRSVLASTLAPLALALAVTAAGLMLWFSEQSRLGERAAHESMVRTLLDTHAGVVANPAGLQNLAGNLDLDRIWVLSATGVVLSSNRADEIGQRLEEAWWAPLRTHEDGYFSERVPYGRQSMVLAGVYDVGLGRWVVTLRQPTSGIPGVLKAVGAGLILSLIILFIAASVLYRKLSGLSRSAMRLDEHISDILRGGSLSEAALDRIEAETTGAMDGHAEHVLDVLRYGQVQRRKASEADARFSALFDAMPGPAFIRGKDGRILTVNDALQGEAGPDRMLRGQPMENLSDLFPTDRLEALLSREDLRHVGFRRLRIGPDDRRLTMIPVTIMGDDAHVFISEFDHMPMDDEPIILDDDADEERSDAVMEAPDSSWSGGDGAGNGPIPEASIAARSPESDVRIPHLRKVSLDRPGDAEENDTRRSQEPGPVRLDNNSASAATSGEPSASRASNSDSHAALIESAMDLDAIYATTDLVVWAIDESGTTVHWSDAAARLTGKTSRQVATLTDFCETVLVDDDQRRRFDAWTDRHPERSPRHLICRLADGSAVGLTWHAREVAVSQGGQVREIGVLWAHAPDIEGT